MSSPILINRVVTQCSIVCDNCGGVDYYDDENQVDAAIHFEKKGWKPDENNEFVYCSKCQSSVID